MSGQKRSNRNRASNRGAGTGERVGRPNVPDRYSSTTRCARTLELPFGLKHIGVQFAKSDANDAAVIRVERAGLGRTRPAAKLLFLRLRHGTVPPKPRFEGSTVLESTGTTYTATVRVPVVPYYRYE